MENLGLRLFPRATHLLIIPLWRKPDLVGHHLTRLIRKFTVRKCPESIEIAVKYMGSEKRVTLHNPATSIFQLPPNLPLCRCLGHLEWKSRPLWNQISEDAIDLLRKSPF